jgi:hypothetical protein
MILDTQELDRVLEKLENMEDEALAVKMLKEFNDLTAQLGKLINNRDPNLETEAWKKMCDDAQDKINDFLDRLENV